MKRFALLVTALLAAVPATATTVMMVNDEALVDRAELIVRARIAEVRPASGPGRPRTEYVLEVADVLKGAAPDKLVMSVIGGRRADGLSLKIWGAPTFRQDGHALLMLSPRKDGTFEPLHLMLGAFHEIEVEGATLAVRDFREVREITLEHRAVRPEPLRDADRFADWIRTRAGGGTPAVDYLVADRESPRSKIAPFNLFEDVDSGNNLRWREFDTAGAVVWQAHNSSQPGAPGGGFSNFQSALTAWNNDPSTPIKYNYGGKTGNDTGFTDFDNANVILFNDPNGEVEGTFSCQSGGVLAIGGPWYDGTGTHNFHGQPFHEIVAGDIITNNGIACFFDDSPTPGKAAEELFAHELGHTLGLDHSCGPDTPDPSCLNNSFEDALMKWLVHDDGRGAALKGDDRAAIAFLYAAASAPAAPSGLEAVAVSNNRVLLLWNDNSTNETAFHIEARQSGGGSFNEVGTVGANETGAVVSGLNGNTSYDFRVRAASGGLFSGYSNVASATTQPTTASCVQDADTMCLNAGRHKVEMQWRASAGAAFVKANRAAAGTPGSGLFFFTDPNNWEMLLKVLNGCGLNNNWWVFFAATTNVEFILTVTDLNANEANVYTNPLNNPAFPVQDTGAFATCP